MTTQNLFNPSDKSERLKHRYPAYHNEHTLGGSVAKSSSAAMFKSAIKSTEATYSTSTLFHPISSCNQNHKSLKSPHPLFNYVGWVCL